MAEDHKAGIHHTAIDMDSKKCKKCIFRVPNVLRRQNPEAFTPDVVSIGPFHHYPEDRRKEEGKGGTSEKDFQLIEGVKQRYLNEILADMNIRTLEELTAEAIKLSDQKSEVGFEQCAREFYAEKFDIPSKDFTEMIIVDGCFLIQLFRKRNNPLLRAFDDPIFTMKCMFHFLCLDILLLENQLPWFVIHSLYNLTHTLYPNEAPLSILILEAFSTLPSLEKSCSSFTNHIHKKLHDIEPDFLHILDLLRSSILFPLRTIEQREHKPADHEVHGAIFDPDLHQIRTATDLSKVGIKFEVSVNKESIMDIRFEEGGFGRNGVLMIPQLNIGMESETLFRNFIATEQCYPDYMNEITSYAIFMDNLISSKDDLELLCQEKVIGNWMNDEDGCKFFSNLYKNIPPNKNFYYYLGLCKEVNSQYYVGLNRLIEKTRRQLHYFSDPWNVFYVTVVILFLQIIPTILQTTYAIKSYYSPRP